jgi:hypothetical protein
MERDICERVAAASGEVVLELWTPATYPYEGLDGQQVELASGYQVKTGRLTEGLFVSGSVYDGHVRNGRLEIERVGTWNS